MYLTRLTLSRRPDVAALAQLLDPADESRRLDAHHRLIWSAFAGDPDARRDFLWRDEGGGRFLVLSPRPPAPGPLFDSVEPRDFSPDLRPGDRLAFLLRTNATRTVKTDRITPSGKREREHRDVVMAALHETPKGARAAVRMDRAEAAARDWLAGQGARGGFRPLLPQEGRIVGEYAVRELPGRRGHSPRFGVLDLSGMLEVTEPAAFLARLSRGFGRARAFGCGLMLIRRV